MSLNHPSVASHKLSFLTSSKAIILIFGLICLLLSFTQVAFFTSGGDIHGYWILIIGWMGLIFFQLSWFANPLSLLALLVLAHKPKTALLIGIVAVVLATQSFQFTEIPVDLNHQKIYITELGLGFYLWLLAHCLFLIYIIIENFSDTHSSIIQKYR